MRHRTQVTTYFDHLRRFCWQSKHKYILIWTYLFNVTLEFCLRKTWFIIKTETTKQRLPDYWLQTVPRWVVTRLLLWRTLLTIVRTNHAQVTFFWPEQFCWGFTRCIHNYAVELCCCWIKDDSLPSCTEVEVLRIYHPTPSEWTQIVPFETLHWCDNAWALVNGCKWPWDSLPQVKY